MSILTNSRHPNRSFPVEICVCHIVCQMIPKIRRYLWHIIVHHLEPSRCRSTLSYILGHHKPIKDRIPNNSRFNYKPIYWVFKSFSWVVNEEAIINSFGDQDERNLDIDIREPLVYLSPYLVYLLHIYLWDLAITYTVSVNNNMSRLFPWVSHTVNVYSLDNHASYTLDYLFIRLRLDRGIAVRAA